MAGSQLPVVGVKALGYGRLSPRVRRILKNRARVAARREAAPVLAADRQAFGAANAAYGVQARSAQAATGMVEGSLTQALRGLKSSGLQGRYLRQAQSEFVSRQADAASALPGLLAGASEERNKALREAHTELRKARTSMQTNAAQKFNEGLGSANSSAASYLKAQSGGGSILDPKAMASAAIAFKDAMATWVQNPADKKTGKRLQQINPLQTQDQLRAFAVGLEKGYAGFNLPEAMAVVNRFAAMRQRQLRQVGQHKRPFRAVSPLVKKTTPLYKPFNAGP
jgi:hypothetical protein